MEKFKGYRTVLFNIVMAVVMITKSLNPDMESPSAEEVQQAVDMLDAAIAAVWGIGNVVLRAITTSPIFKKEPQ